MKERCPGGACHTFNARVGFLLLALLAGLPVLARAADRPDVLIFFDQSASLKEYSQRSTTVAWLKALTEEAHQEHDIGFQGFSDGLDGLTWVEHSIPEYLDRLHQRLDASRAFGLSTDFEHPLSYLAHYDKTVAMAIIISDGEPELWDEKRYFLSQRIRGDQRYQDINEQYQTMLGQGRSPAEVYEALNESYLRRNEQLIGQALESLGPRLGKRLVFVDISGSQPYFPRWARLAGARYFSISLDGSPASLAQIDVLFDLEQPGNFQAVQLAEPARPTVSPALPAPPAVAAGAEQEVQILEPSPAVPSENVETTAVPSLSQPSPEPPAAVQPESPTVAASPAKAALAEPQPAPATRQPLLAFGVLLFMVLALILVLKRKGPANDNLFG